MRGILPTVDNEVPSKGVPFSGWRNIKVGDFNQTANQ